jgi:AcrR family transcriptional regulator
MNMSTPSRGRTRPYRQRVRAFAAEATGVRIVEAFIAAAKVKRYPDITLDEVAADAGVSRQTVIRRFQNKFGLVLAAAPLVAAFVDATRAGAAENDPADAIRVLMRDYEVTGDLVVNVLAEEDRSPELTQVLERGRIGHRRWVEASFGPRLAGLSNDLRERRLVQLHAITDVWVWRLLRRDQKRSADEVTRVLTDLVFKVLETGHAERNKADG